jgi:FAD/FMN-containing dehydrogenase
MAHNARYPTSPSESVSDIALCQNAGDVAEALQRAVSAGKRPTIRSGGNCYADFYINNPNGTLIDVGLMDHTGNLPHDPRYRIGPGATVGKAYQDLYRLFGVTIPGASCTGVTVGGHITGGGYGVLSRLFGLTTDWVSEIEILTVDAKGKVVPRTVNARHDPDLFRACLGAGGGNFGVITDYVLDALPPAPQEVTIANLSFSWADMTEEKFARIMNAYGNYFATRGKDPDTWGLFTGLNMRHKSSGRIAMGVQFCNPDGTCKDLRVLHEFLDLFDSCGADVHTSTRDHHHHGQAGDFGLYPNAHTASLDHGAQQFAENCAICHGGDGKGGQGGPNIAGTNSVITLSDEDLRNIIHNGVGGEMPAFPQFSEQDTEGIVKYLRSLQKKSGASAAAVAPVPGERNGRGGNPQEASCGTHALTRTQWIDTDGSGDARRGTRARAAYKSSYMRKNFTSHEISVFYEHMTREVPGILPAGAAILIDSFGGAVNRKAMGEKTVIFQRSSVLKLQFLSYWAEPSGDAGHIAFLNDLYKDLYTSPQVDANHQGTPYPGEYYQGCYINYPDLDMLEYPYWQELYFGPNYTFLQQVKKKYDPNNIFHHAMSVRA